MQGTLLVVNGPNLNMLGRREPEKYGKKTLLEIMDELDKRAQTMNYKLKSFQSNSEGDIIDFIQREGSQAKGMLLNAGAYTHTSIAIRDAILSVQLPFIEVHLTNVFAREPFRHHSYLSDIAVGVISGFGAGSYMLALTGLVDFIQK